MNVKYKKTSIYIFVEAVLVIFLINFKIIILDNKNFELFYYSKFVLTIVYAMKYEEMELDLILHNNKFILDI